jgi:eukaryotic-like serine/threonine-protein kinase
MIGKILGHHRILEKIGAGGMGEVYRARDEQLERDVALKVLRASALADGTDRRRLRKEALALSKLNHPNIETVHEFDTQDGIDFLVVEYVAGVTLSDKLTRGALTEKEGLRLAEQLADGLAAAHAQGIVHLDLKPGNLRVTPEGRLKILDFGLARLLAPETTVGTTTTETRTETYAVAGTLPYMPPEQLRGEAVDHRSDIWAAGVVLYEMATGRRPFGSELPTALAIDIQTKSPTPPSRLRPGLSPALEHIILKCLEKDPDLRYQSARDLCADFRRLAAAASATEHGTLLPATYKAAERWRGFPVWKLVPVLIVLASAVVGLVFKAKWGKGTSVGSSSPVITSLAVLPLADLSGHHEQDYVVEGLHEALITELSKIRALRVISRTSTIRYKGYDRSLPQVARELGVDAVVEGSVLRSGNRLRVSTQLVQVNPERHLWADKFDRELTDILYLTSDVAQAVAREIRVTLSAADQAQLAGARHVNANAYELYAVGRHHWNQRTLDGYKRAIDSFLKALEQDPGYPPVYAALADSYMLLGEQGGLPQDEARSRAAAAIRKALELDGTLAEAHASLGQWKFYYDWNWLEAEQSFKRAIELNPSYAAVH